MNSWWRRLSLHNKLQIPIQLMLLLVLVLTQIWMVNAFEKDIVEDSEEKAADSAAQSFWALNAMMLNGSISRPDARITFFKKMATQKGVLDFHLVRGLPVQNQFGAGLPEEQAQDNLDRQALASNTVQVQRNTSSGEPTLRVVVPFAAKRDFSGTNCLQCHHVQEGEVNGAVSLTISLKHKYAALAQLRTLLIIGQITLQILLYFVIGLLIQKAIKSVLKLEKTMREIELDGDLSKRASVESGDEVGHIAQVFNHFLQHIEILKQKLADKLIALEHYQANNEREQLIASGYMNKLIALDKLHDEDVQFYLKPAANFSGDLIAFSRTPDNRLHLLLADSTGHGLSAALAAMPLIHPFYSMTGKGGNISAIASEINRQVWKSLPLGHFVSTILVSLDAENRKVEVWNGGSPPPLLLNAEGKCEHQFSPRHLAMGILPPEQFDSSVEYFSYNEEGCSLLMFSDGVTELENEHGELFGMQKLLDAANAATPSARWQNITEALTTHRGNKTSDHDDIALIMAQFIYHGESSTLKKNTPRLAMPERENIVWRFSLTLTMHQLKKIDAVPFLLGMVQQVENSEDRSGEIFMILSELFNNALDHGLLKLTSGLKQQEDGMEKYFDERSARLAQINQGQIDISLKRIFREDGQAFLRIRVKDSGDGFDHQHLSKEMASHAMYHGRGIPLLLRICSSVHFIGNGSEVVVELNLFNNDSQQIFCP